MPEFPDSEFDEDNTRIARNAKGETYKVPANLDYSDWHRLYVESDPIELLGEKKARHGAADAKQFADYSALMGKDAPKGLAEFQNIKYTDENVWNDWKSFARYKRAYPSSDRTFYEINKDIQKLREEGSIDRKIGIAVAPVPQKITSYGNHALQRMWERHFTTEDSQNFIQRASVEFRQFSGTRSAFYSSDGVSVILRKDGALVTGWDKTDFNDGTDRIWEVLKKYGKG